MGSTVHMGMPVCVILQLRASCVGTLNRFTQADGGCSQHWSGHFLLLCAEIAYVALYVIKHEVISIMNKRPTNDVTKMCFILAFPCFN